LPPEEGPNLPLKLRLKYIFLVAILYLSSYFGIQNLVELPAFDFLIPFDKQIPLIPEFIWLYSSLIPVLVASTAFLVRSKKVFWTTVGSIVLSMIVLDICYVLAPSFYPRETLEITNISTWLLDLTRQIDGANNTFPSGHVTLAWILFWAISYSKCALKHPSIKILTGLWAIGISVSTLVLKQHYIVDVIGGFVLAYVCWLTTRWLLKGTKFIQENPQQIVGVSDLAPEIQLAE
jgi:membrane-associated phospholipid phosphatase